jgi:hypothetical protein
VYTIQKIRGMVDCGDAGRVGSPRARHVVAFTAQWRVNVFAHNALTR